MVRNSGCDFDDDFGIWWRWLGHQLERAALQRGLFGQYSEWQHLAFRIILFVMT